MSVVFLVNLTSNLCSSGGIKKELQGKRLLIDFTQRKKLSPECLHGVLGVVAHTVAVSDIKSVMPNFHVLTNQEGETPAETILRKHKDLVQKSDEWLSRTSKSCSVVAALVAGVAYATSSTVPGGNDDKTGKPTLEGRPGFDIFALSALIALSFSVAALIMFLSILTSRKRPADFMKKLPVKLLLALSSLFVSIISRFISFCAAHPFVLEDKSKTSVLPLYAIICLPVSFKIVEFPLYMDLFKGIFMKVQQPYDLRRI
ncbi:uncharacterized protein LOC114717474 [Neltuma alba]|uniref:uncharacterized protein LOC114717474 n=1 Tax=Neltuma alba TaxID=207710 RepID=UPI0010A2B126|nr:uncharacterized protein LOC114717474 [Prosopis alba]